MNLVSLMAANADPLYRALSAWLARRIETAIEVIDDVPWQERERMLDRGEAQVGFICGLPYALKVDRPDPLVELLAAPVMRGARYQDRPVYFSDVVVRDDSAFRYFADLRGACWAYNESGSQSGYNLVRCHLARLGEPTGYFGRVVEAGAHQRSLRMVLDGVVDASAIDSIVLEQELRQHPELAPRLRIVETLGPSPIPPAVASTPLPAALRQALREALIGMHEDREGGKILAAAGIARFVPVVDADYDEIRRMAGEAQAVRLAASGADSSLPYSAAISTASRISAGVSSAACRCEKRATSTATLPSTSTAASRNVSG
jgi:phosphonate transport system substrate-binding protein